MVRSGPVGLGGVRYGMVRYGEANESSLASFLIHYDQVTTTVDDRLWWSYWITREL